MFLEIGPYYHNQFTGVRRRFRVPKDSLVIPGQIWIAGEKRSQDHIMIQTLRLNVPGARPSSHSLRIGTVYRIADMPPTIVTFKTATTYGGLQTILKTIADYEIINEDVYIREYLTSLKEN